MFSDYFSKPRQAHTKAWLLLGAMVLIVCQLAAMRFVALSQVQAAELRQSRLADQRMAVAQCIQSSSGPARNACMSDVMAQGAPDAGGSDQATAGDMEGTIRNPRGMSSLVAWPLAFTTGK